MAFILREHMRIQHIIDEARSHPELNKSSTPLEQIKQFYNNANSKIDRNVTNLFISLTLLDKLGINPQSHYNTPLGIYSYSVDYVLSKVTTNLTALPFVGDSPFISIFKVSSPASVIVLNTMTTGDLYHYMSEINKMPQYAPHIPNDAEINKARVKTPGGVFWYITMKTAQGVATHSSRSIPVVWNGLLRKLGILGCVDTGDGIIHQSEPAQAVFFDVSNITVLGRIKNKLIHSRNQLSDILSKALTLGKNKRNPNIERELLSSPEFAFKYTQDVVGKEWPDAEPIIATSPEYAFYYAKYIRGREWPEAEDTIAKSGYYSMLYAVHVLEDRFPAGEAAIAMDPLSASSYFKKFGIDLLKKQYK